MVSPRKGIDISGCYTNIQTYRYRDVLPIEVSLQKMQKVTLVFIYPCSDRTVTVTITSK